MLDCQEELKTKDNLPEIIEENPSPKAFTNYLYNYKFESKYNIMKKTVSKKPKLEKKQKKKVKKLSQEEIKRRKEEELKKELEEFDQQRDNYVGIDCDTLNQLIRSEVKYSADPYYFDKN